MGQAGQACLVYLVKKVNQELAELERRVSPDYQVLMDLMVSRAARVTKAYQASYLHFTTVFVSLQTLRFIQGETILLLVVRLMWSANKLDLV